MAAMDFDLGNQFLFQAFNSLSDASDVGRLCHIITGPEREGLQCGGRAFVGQRAEHDDRQFRVKFPHFAQRGQAVHLRHFDIEGQQVGVDLR